ncbi:30S ribosomal protein S14 [Holospora obtusa F1]|uniref:Small ribosomal subunit protein uS14 n=1 Tax=Holospora obtusa F1 TaxID=1399147 RepID=W6TGY1_HOLOB|nr:30S ribosomal protein S14 [Holospora obtusa]ETZ07195.1 30S ribosomal protein S14 [Holospora obtusa F1]
MARKGLIESNHRKKRIVQRDKLKRSLLKKTIRDKSISLEERFGCVLKLSKMPRNGSAVRVRERCILTGRSRGVYRFFSLSRIKFRELALVGDLPGVKKSSW